MRGAALASAVVAPAALAVAVLVGCGAPEPGSEVAPAPTVAPTPPEPPSPSSPASTDGDQEVALALREEVAFDLVLALPPSAEELPDAPPETRLFHDPDTGLVLSIERRGEGALWGDVDLRALARRAAKTQGAGGDGEVSDTRLGEAAAVQIDFRAGGAATSTCVAHRNGSLYLFGVTDPGGGEGVGDLLRLLSAAARFTSKVQEAPEPGPDPWAELGVKLPAARGLASSVHGTGGRVTDVVEGWVTVLAGFPRGESPYAGLEGTALHGRLESEGCSVVRADAVGLAALPARRVRCVLGAGSARPEYALLHVVAAPRYEWVVSVVSGTEDWPAAEAYATKLFAAAVLP